MAIFMVTAVRNSNFKYVNADLKPSDWTPAQVKLQQTVSYTPVHIRQMFAYSEHSPVAGHNLNHASLPKVSALEDYSASGWTSSYHDKIVEYSVVAEFGSGTQWIQFHGRMFTDLKILAPDSLKQLSIFMQHPSICVTKTLLHCQPHNITKSVYCCGTPGSFPASLPCFLTLTSLWWSARRTGIDHMLEDLQQQNMSLIQAFWYYSAPVCNIHVPQISVLVRYVTNTFVIQHLRFYYIIQ